MQSLVCLPMTALHAALRATEPFLLSQPQYDLEVCWTESSYSNPFNDEVLTRPYQYHVQAVSAAMSHCALVTVTVLGSREEFASKVHFDAITSLSFATARTVNRWAPLPDCVPAARSRLVPRPADGRAHRPSCAARGAQRRGHDAPHLPSPDEGRQPGLSFLRRCG